MHLLKQLSLLHREEELLEDPPDVDFRIVLEDRTEFVPPLLLFRMTKMSTTIAKTRMAPRDITIIKGNPSDSSFSILIGSPSMVVSMYSTFFKFLTISTFMLNLKGTVELRLSYAITM